MSVVRWSVFCGTLLLLGHTSMAAMYLGTAAVPPAEPNIIGVARNAGSLPAPDFMLAAAEVKPVLPEAAPVYTPPKREPVAVTKPVKVRPEPPREVVYDKFGVVQNTQALDCDAFDTAGNNVPVPCAKAGKIVDPFVSQPIIPSVIASVESGSLKNNIERIARESGWDRTVWKPEYDYNWVGNVTITATDVQGVLAKLLEPYPLQAVFYTANHVVEVIPRRTT